MQSKDLLIHNKIHEDYINQDPSTIFSHRVNVLKYFKNKYSNFSGNILDIGCGNGYASIWIAKNSSQNCKIHALEYTDIAVKQVLPKNISFHKVYDKVIPIKGSFDDLTQKENYNFVISFGALHHSQDLFESFNSISKSMKNNAFLICHEPAMSDLTTNEDYIKKYETSENRKGINLKNYERDDHFFRYSEYITAATFNHLDLIEAINFNEKKSNIISLIKHGLFILKNKGIKSFIIKLINKIINYKKSNKINIGNNNQINDKIFIFKKNQVTYIPHKWKKLVK